MTARRKFPIKTAARALTLAALMAGTSVHAAEPVPDLSKVTLRLGIFQDVTRAAVDATDYLKNTPYKIQWARLNGAGPTVQALGGNAIDLSWGLSDTAAPKASAEDKKPWTAQDAPLKIIALLKPFETTGQYVSGLIAVHKDSGIKTLADLRGKTYAYNEGGNNHAVALLALDAAGLSKKDIQVRLLQYDAIGSALAAGAVQAAIVRLAMSASALADGSIRQIATEQEVGFPGYVSITARTESVNDPKLQPAIADFLTRVGKYLNWAARHPDEIAKAYVKTQQLTPEQALIAARSTAFTPITVGRNDPGVVAEIALTERLTKVGFYVRPIDFTALIDDRFSDAINAGNADTVTQ